MTLACSITFCLSLLIQFSRAFVLLPDEWDDSIFTLDSDILSSSADELSTEQLEFLEIGEERYPVRDAFEFRTWNTKLWTGGAAFVYEELAKNPTFFPFNANSMDKFQYLSNLATTPYCFEGLGVQSVESLIFAHHARVHLRNERLADRLASMDGLSARQVGKHFDDRTSRNQLQSFVESKLIQHPKVYKMAKSLINEGMLLVCTDQTSFDYHGFDRRFGMARHGKYIVGENMLGKIYHNLHKEM